MGIGPTCGRESRYMLVEMVRVLALLLTVAALVAPRPVLAAGDEGDFDRLDRADRLTDEAVAAAKAGEWLRAKELAETVLTLDDSFATAEARWVLIQALEWESLYDAALYELSQYQALDGLPEERLAEAGRLKTRLESKRDGTWIPEPMRRRGRHLGPGIALVVGGAVPLVLGLSFVATDIHWASQDVESGTWAAIGTPLMITGLALDITGIILLARAPRFRPSGVASRQRPAPSLGLSVGRTDEGWRLAVSGRW